MNKFLGLLLISLSIFFGCSLILEEDISKDTLEVLSPANKDTLDVGMVNFWWEELADATQYQFQLVSPSFEKIDSIVIDSLATKNLLIFDLDSGGYQWRVKAVNNSYETNYIVREFLILPDSK